MQGAANLKSNSDLSTPCTTLLTALDNAQLDSTISPPNKILDTQAQLFLRCEAARQSAELANLQAGTNSGFATLCNVALKVPRALKTTHPPSLPQQLSSTNYITLEQPHVGIQNGLCTPHAVHTNLSEMPRDLTFSNPIALSKPPPQTVKELVEQKTTESAPLIRSLQRKALKHLDPNAFQGGPPPSADALEAAVRAMATEAISDDPLLYRDHVFKRACEKGVASLEARETVLKTALAARNTGIAAVHADAKKAWKAARAKAQRERLEALKSDDLEGYMHLVQSAKSSQIESLLSQTDLCLRQLAARLQTTAKALAPVAVPSAPSTSPGVDVDKQPKNAGPAEGDFSALKQSSEAWNTLAAVFNADIAEQPELLTGGELREYQMRGLRWMVSLRDNGLNGILADEMGLGKTVQVIALVAHCLRGSNSASGSGDKTMNTIDPFLIAAPASVLPNWEKEFARWAPEIKVVCYRGPAAEREELFRKEMRRVKGGGGGTKNGQRQYKFHVALTSYEYLMGKNDRPRLASIPWSYIVVDEGHR